MKLNLTHLKQFLPDLPSDTKKVSHDLAMIGHFVAGIDGHILDLEIRSNRPDCLSYWGLAHDLSAYYHIPISFPNYQLPDTNHQLPQTPITIDSPDVYRILSLSLSNLTVSTSPPWLNRLLADHDINSINNVVDITNYIMLVYGIPCHAFDADISQKLIWHRNLGKHTTFTSLDGTKLKLEAETLVISNQKNPLSLSFIGGQNSGITTTTKNTIIEMAVYNPSRVRSDSRNLKTITEASIRLGKDLDPNLIPRAFAHLIKLIADLAGGQVSTKLFDLYPKKSIPKPIRFHSRQASLYAGITIDPKITTKILTDIGCSLAGNLITPPSYRTDITLAEDLIEEVIRLHGYQHIPTNQPIDAKPTKDITPPVLFTITTVQNLLTQLGYDEIRTWPLSSPSQIIDQKTVIYTQNSINSDFPALRQSLIPGLASQLDQYRRLKLPIFPFFEIGKIFYQDQDGTHQERWSLALYHPDATKLQTDLAVLNLECSAPIHFAQINLDQITLPITKPDQTRYHAYELKRQLVTLDANLEFSQKQDATKLLKKYIKKIGVFCWQLIITDIYQDQKTNHYRYTLQASYFNLSSKKAKQLHLKVFNLL